MIKVPQVVKRYNVYRGGNKLIGLSGEITLPTITYLVDSQEGAGTGGNLDVPVVGLTDNMEVQINFLTVNRDLFSMADPTGGELLTIRGGLQGIDPATQKIVYTSVAITMGGTVSEINPGTMKAGGKMDASIKMNLTRYKVVLDDVVALEIDKMNSIYTLNGKDILKEVRDMC